MECDSASVGKSALGGIEVLGHLDVDLVTVSPDNGDRVDAIR
jgi:hypothetical protein